MSNTSYAVPPTPGVEEELARSSESYKHLVNEAVGFLDDPDVDDVALARMFIERGYSEELAYWLVREAEVKHAPN
jgi:hypothetical protein